MAHIFLSKYYYVTASCKNNIHEVSLDLVALLIFIKQLPLASSNQIVFRYHEVSSSVDLETMIVFAVTFCHLSIGRLDTYPFNGQV